MCALDSTRAEGLGHLLASMNMSAGSKARKQDPGSHHGVNQVSRCGQDIPRSPPLILTAERPDRCSEYRGSEIDRLAPMYLQKE